MALLVCMINNTWLHYLSLYRVGNFNNHVSTNAPIYTYKCFVYFNLPDIILSNLYISVHDKCNIQVITMGNSPLFLCDLNLKMKICVPL